MKKLPGSTGLEIEYKYRQIRITIDGQVKLIFKQIDSRLRPRSTPTKRAMAILNQVEALLHPLPDPPTNLIVGHQWNVLETGVQLYVICPFGSQ